MALTPRLTRWLEVGDDPVEGPLGAESANVELVDAPLMPEGGPANPGHPSRRTVVDNRRRPVGPSGCQAERGSGRGGPPSTRELVAGPGPGLGHRQPPTTPFALFHGQPAPAVGRAPGRPARCPGAHTSNSAISAPTRSFAGLVPGPFQESDREGRQQAAQRHAALPRACRPARRSSAPRAGPTCRAPSPGLLQPQRRPGHHSDDIATPAESDNVAGGRPARLQGGIGAPPCPRRTRRHAGRAAPGPGRRRPTWPGPRRPAPPIPGPGRRPRRPLAARPAARNQQGDGCPGRPGKSPTARSPGRGRGRRARSE